MQDFFDQVIQPEVDKLERIRRPRSSQSVLQVAALTYALTGYKSGAMSLHQAIEYLQGEL
jgi:hypothetical protein